MADEVPALMDDLVSDVESDHEELDDGNFVLEEEMFADIFNAEDDALDVAAAAASAAEVSAAQLPSCSWPTGAYPAPVTLRPGSSDADSEKKADVHACDACAEPPETLSSLPRSIRVLSAAHSSPAFGGNRGMSRAAIAAPCASRSARSINWAMPQL